MELLWDGGKNVCSKVLVTIREFRTLFVMHTDSIREKLDNKDGRVHNRVEKRRQNCVSRVLGLGRNIYIIKPRILTDSSLSALFLRS